jgi:hypothetical protein
MAENRTRIARMSPPQSDRGLDKPAAMPQLWRVGRAVLCAPCRDYGCTPACRGLPALPPLAVTEALQPDTLSACECAMNAP